MLLAHRPSQNKISAEIVLVSNSDLQKISKDKRFGFDWKMEAAYEVYALELAENKQVVGLMSLQNVPEELRLEIRLLESSRENVGQTKEHEHIAGSLIAFACKIAFARGYFGFVSLVPKTELVEHYMNAYGFEQYGRHLATELKNSERLIKKFLEHDNR